MKFIKRDVPQWEDKPHEPSNPQSWYKVYRKLRTDSIKEIEEDARALEAALKGIKTEQAKHTIKHVHPSTVPKLPKMGGMIYATSLPHFKKPKKPPPPKPTALNFAAGSRTKTLTGAGVMNKARREAKQLSLCISKSSKLAKPTHELMNRAAGVYYAPDNFVDDYRRPVVPKAVDPTVKQSTIFVPKRKIVNNASATNGMSIEEKERRLKAFTNPGSARASSPSTSSPPSSPLPSIAPPNLPEAAETQLSATTDTSPSIASGPQNTSVMSPQSTNTAYPASAYRVPRLKSISPEIQERKPMIKKRAPVDPFMPVKRRKVA